MCRGVAWKVDLEPVRGSEASKRRPAVLVSNDRANTTAARLGRGVVTVVPVTSNVSRVFAFQALHAGSVRSASPLGQVSVTVRRRTRPQLNLTVSFRHRPLPYRCPIAQSGVTRVTRRPQKVGT